MTLNRSLILLYIELYFIGLGYDEFYNGKFIPTDKNYTNEELEEIFQKSYNENYYLLDPTGTFTCNPKRVFVMENLHRKDDFPDARHCPAG